jgi:hypothetical protein
VEASSSSLTDSSAAASTKRWREALSFSLLLASVWLSDPPLPRASAST